MRRGTSFRFVLIAALFGLLVLLIPMGAAVPQVLGGSSEQLNFTGSPAVVHDELGFGTGRPIALAEELSASTHNPGQEVVAWQPLAQIPPLVVAEVDGVPPRREAVAQQADGTPKMYWTDSGTDKISRANLDGTEVEDLVTGLSGPLLFHGPWGIALDVAAGKVYWTFWDTQNIGLGKIQRANLDGTQLEDLVTSRGPGTGEAKLSGFRRGGGENVLDQPV